MRTQRTKPGKSIAKQVSYNVSEQNEAIPLYRDNRPEVVLQRKLQEMANRHTSLNHDVLQPKFINNRQPLNTNLQTIQRFSEEDVKFMYGQKMGLRHHDDHLSARLENLTGTKGGDAVPLNPLGAHPELGLPLMGFGTIPPEAIEQFTTNVGRFVSKSLERTVNINLGVTTPKDVVNTALDKSTFLLVNGMKGTEVPKDVEKSAYAGLGKAGKQEIKPSQIVSLMSLDDVGVEFMKFMHGEEWEQPIATVEQGDQIFNDLVLIFVEKLKDAVHKLRTGRERFME